jgi:hypothetical protein
MEERVVGFAAVLIQVGEDEPMEGEENRWWIQNLGSGWASVS